MLIEEVYEEIQFIMATQGYKMDNTRGTLNEAETPHTTCNGVFAFGVYDGECFEVLDGSKVDMSRKCHSAVMEKQRQIAVANGDIICDNGKYKLKVSVSFASPSSTVMSALDGSTRTEKHWIFYIGNKRSSFTQACSFIVIIRI